MTGVSEGFIVGVALINAGVFLAACTVWQVRVLYLACKYGSSAYFEWSALLKVYVKVFSYYTGEKTCRLSKTMEVVSVFPYHIAASKEPLIEAVILFGLDNAKHGNGPNYDICQRETHGKFGTQYGLLIMCDTKDLAYKFAALPFERAVAYLGLDYIEVDYAGNQGSLPVRKFDL